MSRKIGATCAGAYGNPRTICYSVHPNRYLEDHAGDVAKMYDGFFFNIGSWEDGIPRAIGLDGDPKDRDWAERAGRNVAALSAAGADENFLTVHFPAEGEWPSPETLLARSTLEKMSSHFGALGRAARDLGFRGVCVDVEYPYPRYDVSNPVYTYQGYRVCDLLAAAKAQGSASAAAVLDEFPEAVVLTLPGVLRCRPIARSYLLGFLSEMARRDAPGGMHLGTEFTYCLNDPVTNLAAPRSEDCAMPWLVERQELSYWRSRCTIAPGVWPLHLVETGGKDYPARPWKEEVAELRQQMAILRSVAKRYVWSFSSAPIWYLHSPSLEARYGLAKPELKRPDIDVGDWHSILRDRAQLLPPELKRLRDAVARFDRGELTGEELCDLFGTPGRWWVLGMLGNPRTHPEYAADEALLESIDPQKPYHGRDGVVRWFAFDNMDPRGIVSCVYLFEWRNTDDASAHFSTFILSPRPKTAYLNLGWDDGLVVRLGERVVSSDVDYPAEGHGFLYRDRYIFEKRIRVKIPEGRTRLSVTSLNSHGNWVFSLRVTDAAGIPFDDIKFRLQ